MQAEIFSTGSSRLDMAVLSERLSARIQSAWPMLKLAASRAIAVLAQFAVQIIVGSSAGPATLGILQLFTSWTCIAGEVLALGLPVQALRQVSVNYSRGDSRSVRKLLRVSRDRILRASLIISIPSILLLTLLSSEDSSAESGIYLWLAVAVVISTPLFSILRLYAESLKATDAALPAVSIESLCTPVALLFVCSFYWINGQPVSIAALIIAFIVSLCIAPVTLLRLIKKRLTGLVRSVSHSRNPSNAPPRDLAYLWACGILSIVFLHLPFLVMPWFVPPSEIGVFSAAYKLMNIVTTILLLLAAIYGPKFARCAAQGDCAALLSLLRRTQLISIGLFLPGSAIIIVLAEPLGTLFGSGFSGIKNYLLILAAGHLVNAATGLSGVLLNMSGAAHRELYTLISAITFILVMSFWIGPDYGPAGIALIFACGVAIKNMASYLLARSFLNSPGTML